MRHPTRRATIIALLAALPAASFRSAAAATHFPSRSLTLVVGFPPGGATDATARSLQPQLQQQLGQPLIVENAAGAGGSIGVQRMLKANADGHVLYLGTASDTVLAPMAIASARYTADSLRLLALLGSTDFAIVVRPTLDIASIDALLARAGGAGKSLSYASFGQGSIYQFDWRRSEGAQRR